MPITRYDDIDTRKGRAGHIHSSSAHFSRLSRKVGGRAAEVRSVTVDTATGSTTYTIVVSGVTIAVTSASSTSKNAIVTQLVDAINGNATLGADLYAVESPDATDALYIYSRRLGEAFTLTESDSNLSIAVVTAADAGDAIPPGVIVCQSSTADEAELPSPPSAQVVHLTPATGVDATVTAISIRMTSGPLAGNTYQAESLSTAGTVKNVVEALTAAINTAMPASSVVATEDDAKVILTAELPGAGFEVLTLASDDATEDWTIATSVANSLFSTRVLGVCVLEQKLELNTPSSTLVEFDVGTMITVADVGTYDVLLDSGETIAVGDPVFVRHTAGGSEQRGACRGDADSGDCSLLTGARFISTNFTGLDGQNCATFEIFKTPVAHY
jgi:hypothetical protein